MYVIEKLKYAGLVIFIICVSGCATIKIDRHTLDVNLNFHNKTLSFEELGNVDKLPDNVDGFINLLWTNDEKKKQVIEQHYHLLRARVQYSGVNVVTDSGQSDILGVLLIKSVRFDPIGGWITDGASIELLDSKSNKKLATIRSGDAFLTPSLNVMGC
jgi:hypothetical protein